MLSSSMAATHTAGGGCGCSLPPPQVVAKCGGFRGGVARGRREGAGLLVTDPSSSRPAIVSSVVVGGEGGAATSTSHQPRSRAADAARHFASLSYYSPTPMMGIYLLAT